LKPRNLVARDLLKEDWAKRQNYESADAEWNDAADRNELIPAALDTLGMSELAMGYLETI